MENKGNSKGISFPDPGLAGGDGLLTVGGDLSPETLVNAYSHGIFPWYHESSPILWWSPDPRMILFPAELKVSKSLRQVLHKNKYRVSFDRDFESVIVHCAKVPRKGQEGDTWITPDMIDAYIRLHGEGLAHSVEAYLGNKLAGGLYGVSLGRVFFGESMFFLQRDASKVALVHLVERLQEWEFDMIDVQQSTAHMKRLGAREISRDDFLARLVSSLKKPSIRGNWSRMSA